MSPERNEKTDMLAHSVTDGIQVMARPALSIAHLIRIQALCDDGLSDSEIADRCEVDAALVAELVAKEAWRDRRLLTPEMEKTALESQRAFHARWKRAVEAKARWLTLRGMELAETAADSKSARDFKDAAQGARMFHEIATAGDEENGKAAGPSFALFFIEPAGQVAPEMKRVEQIAGADPAPTSAAPAPTSASEDSEF